MTGLKYWVANILSRLNVPQSFCCSFNTETSEDTRPLQLSRCPPEPSASLFETATTACKPMRHWLPSPCCSSQRFLISRSPLLLIPAFTSSLSLAVHSKIVPPWGSASMRSASWQQPKQDTHHHVPLVSLITQFLVPLTPSPVIFFLFSSLSCFRRSPPILHFFKIFNKYWELSMGQILL